MKKPVVLCILLLIAINLCSFGQQSVSMEKYQSALDSIKYYKEEAKKSQMIAEASADEAMMQATRARELQMHAEMQAKIADSLSMVAQMRAEEAHVQAEIAMRQHDEAMILQERAMEHAAHANKVMDQNVILQDSIQALNRIIQELKLKK